MMRALKFLVTTIAIALVKTAWRKRMSAKPKVAVRPKLSLPRTRRNASPVN